MAGGRPWISLGTGVIAGTALRAILPHDRGLSFLWNGTFHVVPINRMAFWGCVGTAVVVAVALVAKRAAPPKV